MAEDSTTTRTIRRQRVVIVATVVALVVSLGGLGASLMVKSPAQRAAEQRAPEKTTLTVPLAKRVLVSTTVVRGSVGPVSAVPIAPAAADGTSIVTAIPVKVGDKVAAGGILAYVSGRPVFALPGKIPAYRDLRPNARGADVKQLQIALVSLGHLDKADVSGHFGAKTARGITAWYAAHGLEAAQTSDADPAELDAIAAASKDVTAAERALVTVRAAEPSDQRQIKDARTDLTAAQDRLGALRAKSGPFIKRNELVFLPTMPASIGEITANVGDDLAKAEKPLMSVQTGGLVVKSTVPAGSETGIAAKQKVVIVDDINRREAKATVTTVGTYQGPGSGNKPEPGQQSSGQTQNPSEAPAGYPVLITPDKPLDAGWSGLDVRVSITTGETNGEVLVAPVSALTTKADQSTIVTILSGEQRREVQVTVGVSTGGEVEITPKTAADLKAGDQVVVG